MNKINTINFKQPKYILPAILYPLLLVTGYFVIDMFHTKKADIGDPSMQTTEYLNPNLPQPKVKDDLGGKYENMLRSYGRIDDLTAVDNIDREDKDADKVSLMTIHAAKGLEFPYVYVVGMEENLFPGILSLSTREELEEERRLFYVAITRAERHCILTCAQRLG